MANTNIKYQISKLKQNLKRTNDPVIRDRIRMVKGAYELSVRKAAKTEYVSKTKIGFWKKRYEKLGVKGLEHTKPTGRPCAISEDKIIKIKKEAKSSDYKNGWQVKQLRQFIYKQAGVKYSEYHVVRIANKWGLSMITPRAEYAHKDKLGERAFKKKPKNC